MSLRELRLSVQWRFSTVRFVKDTGRIKERVKGWATRPSIPYALFLGNKNTYKERGADLPI